MNGLFIELEGYLCGGVALSGFSFLMFVQNHGVSGQLKKIKVVHSPFITF
ncbi:hypothetical protein J2Z66_004624 [Paenibacillus eucommiae]|uniref:Uncharacterized protein n=1 Tax=Paenibacillus eucommiae TaxID=1355755 RepID=A0ABS4IZI3_9BACL|nr:hypothetical protein [Paenibacillus eucommiae]